MKRYIHIFTAMIVTAIASLSLAFVPADANAQLFKAAKEDACEGSQLTATAADCSGASEEVDNVIATVINILSIIVGIVAVIMLIINGLRFITAGGDANSISSARNGVIYAIVGLIIVALAQVIVRFVVARTA